MAALCLLILAALAPTASFATDDPPGFTVVQVFTTSSAKADSTFTYKVKPLGPDEPILTGGKADGYTFSITGNGNVYIDSLDFSQPGIYKYEVFQLVGEEKPGYKYDKRSLTVELYVGADKKVDVIVKDQKGNKVDSVLFENSYSLAPSDPELMVDPPVKKTVSGNPNKNSKFKFKLTAGDPSFPMPEGSSGGAKTLQIEGSGEGEFGTWSYDKAGVYFYTVSEVNTGESGYSYDTTVYTITDTVTEINGQLELSRIVTNDSNKRVSTMTYINKYSPGLQSAPSNPGTPGIAGPKTGDDTDTTYYRVLFTIGGALAAGALIYLIFGGKRRKKDSRLNNA